MFKHKIRSKKQLPKFGRTKKDAIQPRVNIFELIDALPKKVESFLPFNDYQENILFAENCLTFLQYHNKEILQNVSFKINEDTIETFTGRLVGFITSLGYTIGYSEEEDYHIANKGEISILFDIPFSEMWYIVEAKYLDRIENENLKIGYAKLLENMSSVCEDSALNSDYDDEVDTPIPFILEIYLENECEDDDEESDHQRRFEVEQYLEHSKGVVERYKNYKNQDIKNFYDGVVTSEKEAKLKEIIQQGLESINFNSIHWFANNSLECNDDCLIRYETFFRLAIDYNNQFEEENINYLEQDCNNNGYSTPSGYWLVSNGNVKLETSQENVDAFVNCCKYIEVLTTFLTNEYNNE